MFKYLLSFLLIVFTVVQVTGQEAPETPEKSKFKAFLVNVGYGFHMPGGDMKDRFGSNSSAGLQIEFIYQGYFAGIEGDFLFGGTVKTDVLAPLRTPEGALIGDDFEFAIPRLSERGFYTGGYVGKVFPVLKNHPRSGLRVSLGLGLLSHKINIADEAGTLVQLQGEYKKGYDRLTNGLATRQFIGYHHFSRNRLINFYAGFEFTQGFTKSRRDFNFDTMEVDTNSRLDAFYGFRIGWTLPIFIGEGDEYFY
ncbi:MAG: hypothetical protein AAF502_14865 [Bacteroidota bacterium]